MSPHKPVNTINAIGVKTVAMTKRLAVQIVTPKMKSERGEHVFGKVGAGTRK